MNIEAQKKKKKLEAKAPESEEKAKAILKTAKKRSDSSDSSSDSDSDSRKKAKKHKKQGKKKKHKKSKKARKSSSEDSSDSEQELKSNNMDRRLIEIPSDVVSQSGAQGDALNPGDMWDDATKHRPVESEDMIGPKPKQKDSALDARNYGGALLPGEGEAIAGFVQAGKRIPRRGEVGVTSDQIEAFETLGYVMSGSRHKRMNAIRIRKENQVYSAEEKRALSLLNFEERANKEKKLMADFHRYLLEKDNEK